MFKLLVIAKTMPELKIKLQDAADHISDTVVHDPGETEASELGYADPVVDAKPEKNMSTFAGRTEVATGYNDNVTRDENGIAFDAHIHMSPPTITTNGMFRKRRGSDDAAYAEYTAKFKAAGKGVQGPMAPNVNVLPPVPAAPAVPALPPPPAPTVAAAIPNFQTPPPVAQPPVVQPVAPVAAPSYENVPMPPAADQKPAHTFETFRQNFVPTMTLLIQTKKINQEYINQLTDYFKVKSIFEVTKNEDQLRQFFQTFTQAGLITKVD